MRWIVLVALAALLGTGTRPVQAQGGEPVAVSPGTRIRVTAEAPGRTTGTLLALSGGDILMRSDRTRDSIHVSLGTVRSLEVSEGTRRRRLLGAALGYVGGLAVGGLVGYLVLDAGQSSDSNLSGMGMYLGGTVGVVGGVTTGLILGSRPVERWRRVTVPVGSS
jgi:hypothetical protein